MDLTVKSNGSLISGLIFTLMLSFTFSCGDSQHGKRGVTYPEMSVSEKEDVAEEGDQPVYSLLVLPKNPVPGESFRILATGGKNIHKAQIIVRGPSGELKSQKSKTGNELPYWRIDDFAGSPAGNYNVTLVENRKTVSELDFVISPAEPLRQPGVIWKTLRGWDKATEVIYSAWINALFQGCNEQTSWSSLHEVTQNRDQNFLYNYLSLDEDDPKAKNSVIMKPDCADNPFFLRAYFACKLGLPFGYHVCDRGYLGRNPGTGQWITNETTTSKKHPVIAFNAFLRRIMDGVHSGTARTSLDNENSDYYPVPLERSALRPGTVYADPYGHTLILISRRPQTNSHPGLLLSVDAQPDGTVAIKRFWKGNFLFNTSGVVGEPGFKAFRPIIVDKGVLRMKPTSELTAAAGFIPYSLQQRNMESDIFYHTMERLINPKPLEPEAALSDLIQALHEQLIVRVTSVANGEAYFKSNPGTIIPMPSSAAGIFLAGGQWENFSTPNRDLRLLIAMDAVVSFPDYVAGSPEDFKTSGSPEQVKKKLQTLLDKKTSELSITYIRSDGSNQELTISEILKRRDSFEIGYNPNDGVEIRWGAPEKSRERSTCRRQAPANQRQTMQNVRKWFINRLHPPT